MADDLFKAGTVVETSFGVGVVIEQRNPEDGGHVGVRLWRMPGHSIGTAATAWLQPQAVSFGKRNGCGGAFTFFGSHSH